MRNIVCGGVGVIVLTWISMATGASLLVDGAGAGDYTTIQAAIEGAQSGDEIAVAPGTYYEAIDFKGKALHLHSTAGSGSTTIDGTGHRHVVQCVSGEGSGTILEGFTVTGGSDWEPLDDIEAIGYGGGMYNENSSPVVADCVFSGNVARFGAGMYNSNGSPTITRCTFADNYAGNGGGIFNENSDPLLTHCTFSDNSAVWSGGGMAGGGAMDTLTHCTFRGNAAHMGGALSGVLAVSDCEFTGNAALYGGGIATVGTVFHCTFADNDASTGGGLFSAEGVAGCTFLRNADSLFDADVVINSTFREDLGTAAVTNAGIVVNCTFIDNAYAGLMARADGQSLVTHCTFTGNQVGITHFQEGDTVVANCIIWDNVLAAIQDPATVTYSNIEGGWEGEGNIDGNPLFADVQGRLSAGSPCIDAGTNDPPGGLMPIDLEGNPRPLDGNGDGNVVADMGAYEHPAVPVQPANPGQLLAALADAVAGLKLSQGIETALNAKLATARKVLEDGNRRNDVAAANTLKAFVHCVWAQRGKKIAQADADALIAAAQEILDLLDNG